MVSCYFGEIDINLVVCKFFLIHYFFSSRTIYFTLLSLFDYFWIFFFKFTHTQSSFSINALNNLKWFLVALIVNCNGSNKIKSSNCYLDKIYILLAMKTSLNNITKFYPFKFREENFNNWYFYIVNFHLLEKSLILLIHKKQVL